MATTFYPRDTSEGTSMSWSSNPDSDTKTAYNLSTSRGSSVIAGSQTLNPSAPGPLAGVTFGSVGGFSPKIWAVRINAVTISGSITANIRASENAMTDNIGAQVIIERRDSTGAWISNVCSSEKGTELGLSEAAQNWAITPTSTTFSDGDYLTLRILGNDGGGTYAQGGVMSVWANGGTAGASGDTYITFTETITVYTPPSDQPYISPYRQILGQ